MPVIRLHTVIHADIEVCFDMARNIDVHQESTSRTREKAVAGRTSGLIGPGETVTWEAVHFGIQQQLTTRITRYNRPHYFVDEMVTGAFHSFAHAHLFRRTEEGTLMVDIFRYKSPLGPLGRLADWLFLKRYMTRFLRERAQYLKRAAESNRL